MPGSSAAEQQAVPSLGRLLAAARVQQSARRLEREPEQPVQRRLGRKTSSSRPKQSWPLPRGRLWRSTDKNPQIRPSCGASSSVLQLGRLLQVILHISGLACPTPTPGCFLTKSAESLEKKRVAFCVSAKKRKRVRKNLKRKNLSDGGEC